MLKYTSFLVLFLCNVVKAEIDKALLKRYLPKNPIILDGGAHDGRTSMELSNYWPEGLVYAFEPVPDLYNSLLIRIKSQTNITPFKLALGESVGIQKIYISQGRGDGSSSLLKPTGHLQHFPDVTFQKEANVNVTTLDVWAQENNVSHIDLLWLDLQGMELQVLKASPKILKTVRAILTEINFTTLYEGNALYPVFRQWLAEQGFVEVYKELQHHTFGDALFVRQELMNR